MELVLQDVAVSAVAFGAALVLVHRLYAVVASSRKSSSCGACAGCEQRTPALNSQART